MISYKRFLCLIAAWIIPITYSCSQIWKGTHPYGQDYDPDSRYQLLSHGPRPDQIKDTLPIGPMVTFVIDEWWVIALIGKPRVDGKWDAWDTQALYDSGDCCNPYWETYTENGMTFQVLNECDADSGSYRGSEFGNKSLQRSYWLIGDSAHLYFRGIDYDENYEEEDDGSFSRSWCAGTYHFSGDKLIMAYGCFFEGLGYDPSLDQDIIGISEYEYKLTKQGWIEVKSIFRKFKNNVERNKYKSNFREGSRDMCKWNFE